MRYRSWDESKVSNWCDTASGRDGWHPNSASKHYCPFLFLGWFPFLFFSFPSGSGNLESTGVAWYRFIFRIGLALELHPHIPVSVSSKTIFSLFPFLISCWICRPVSISMGLIGKTSLYLVPVSSGFGSGCFLFLPMDDS